MKVEVLVPHGFCAGVTGALRKAAELDGFPVYALHELVHNELVIEGLRARGFVFVESIEDVPNGATVLFSAHGVSPAVRVRAIERGLKVIDATCPFVKRVHAAAKGFSDGGLPVVIIGHRDHAEVKGIVGEVKEAYVYPELPPSGRFGVVSQTTMNADEVAEIVSELRRTRDVETMAEVCNATKDRQDAVKAFSGDRLLVLGSSTSSNTRRLTEVAKVPTVMAGTMKEVKDLDFSGVGVLGVTSGASTPEEFFEEAVRWLRSR